MKRVGGVMLAAAIILAPGLVTADSLRRLDRSIDFAASRADAVAKANSAAHLNNKSSNEAKQSQAQAAKATGGSVKLQLGIANVNKNTLKTGDIVNANVNENKQSVVIGVPGLKRR